MLTLAFDTTGGYCSVVLYRDQKKIGFYSKETDFGQAEMLMVQIEQMLKENNLNFKDLSLAAVCVGPGSFTGVRSSVAAARAFALASPDTAVCGVSAFEAYAAALDPEEISEINAVLIETKRDDFYVQYFDRSLKKIAEPSAAHHQDIIEYLKGKSVTLCGDGVERFLASPSGLQLHTVKLDQALSVEVLAKCAMKKFEQKIINFPKPIYIKAPDVCVK